MIKALIFDFDGVLVSSEGPRFRAIQAIAAKHDVIIADSAIKVAFGKTTANFLTEVLAEDEQPLIETLIKEFRNDYVANITNHVQPIDFTVAFIRDYQGTLPIAIASMSSRIAIESLLKHFGIFEKVKLIVSRDEVTNHKPDPEIYLKTANDLNVTPQDCIVFEDTVVGVQAGQQAGMKCCVVLNGLNQKEHFEDMKIAAFVSSEEEMEAVLKEL